MDFNSSNIIRIVVLFFVLIELFLLTAYIVETKHLKQYDVVTAVVNGKNDEVDFGFESGGGSTIIHYINLSYTVHDVTYNTRLKTYFPRKFPINQMVDIYISKDDPEEVYDYSKLELVRSLLIIVSIIMIYLVYKVYED